jgi:hypothetical protein
MLNWGKVKLWKCDVLGIEYDVNDSKENIIKEEKLGVYG